MVLVSLSKLYSNLSCCSQRAQNIAHGKCINIECFNFGQDFIRIIFTCVVEHVYLRKIMQNFVGWFLSTIASNVDMYKELFETVFLVEYNTIRRKEVVELD